MSLFPLVASVPTILALQVFPAPAGPFMNSNLSFYLSLLLLVAATLGCSATVRKPQLPHPGPANFQRNNAEQFDPYPQNDVGPAIVGGRPPDYMMPRSLVERARQQQPFGPWRSAAPAPPTAIPVGPLY